jgi:hypothetical protein
MPEYADRIKPTDYGISTYLESLLNKRYQIPTFQRDVVWQSENVKLLWDSVYRFYPVGSILIWKTGIRLQNHRAIGGHAISGGEDAGDFQYVLDGQQRTTSLLTSLYGGRIHSKPEFDPTVYIDLTVTDEGEADETRYRQRFLFAEEIQSATSRDKLQKGLIVKLHDVWKRFGNVERALVDQGYTDYDDPVRDQLRKVKSVLDNYRLSFIELKGIDIAEVCQIFERTNQAGKPLTGLSRPLLNLAECGGRASYPQFTAQRGIPR